MGRKVTLSDPSPEGIVAELLLLLEEISSDGLITEDEAKRLHEWLTLNRDAGILAFDFLRTTLDHVLADGKITDPERKAIHKAVERVLPPELRLGARTSREARELVERARVEEERASKRQAKEEGAEGSHGRTATQPTCLHVELPGGGRVFRRPRSCNRRETCAERQPPLGARIEQST